MEILEVKKWELETYMNFNIYSRKKIVEDLLTDLKNKTRYSHTLYQWVSELNSKKDSLQNYFSYYFKDSFFSEINIHNILKKIEKIEEFLKKYQINPKTEKILVYENISELNQDNNFIKDYIFWNKIEIEVYWDVIITNINRTNKFKNILIDWNFTINSSSYDLEFENFNVTQEIVISNLWERSYEFTESKLWRLNLSESKWKINEITFKKCTGNIDISNLEIKKLFINNSGLNSIKLINNTFEDRLKISCEGENILKQKIEHLEFKDNTINWWLRIWHLSFWKIEIYNLKNLQNNEINIWNINVDSFIFSNVRNLWKIRFYNINFWEKNNKYKLININNSSFWDSEFQNINLNSFKKVQIYDTLFSGLNYTWVQWAYKIFADKESNYWKLRNSYRVLKDIAEKNNDNVTALKFYSEEMRTYKLYLKNSRWRIIDKIIMSFNQYTSNFGLDFILPILLILLLNSAIVLLVMLLSSNYWFTSFSAQNFYHFLWYYSNSFNITYDFKDIFGVELNKEESWLNLFIVLKNVLYWTLIYQTVMAFRKFSRKV